MARNDKVGTQIGRVEPGRLFNAGTIALVLVGLPARGKTHVGRSLRRYLRWLGVQTQVFHVGDYRRRLLSRKGSQVACTSENENTSQSPHQIADIALEDMIKWLNSSGQVGIYDASNITEERRRIVLKILEENNIQTISIESICDDPKIIEANVRNVKISSPDYTDWDPNSAVKDFVRRINSQVPHYETITDRALSFVKLINAGDQFILNNIHGYLPTRIVFYLMNLHINQRAIYFAMNGEASIESYKADPSLSTRGLRYAENLKNVILTHRRRKALSGEEIRPLTVWTSNRHRAVETAQSFPKEVEVRQMSDLLELNPGEIDEMTEDEIKKKYPEEYVKHRQDPYNHRYPRGESYHELAIRLEGIILQLEREKNDVLILADETVLRTLYAYHFGRPTTYIPHIHIPRDTLIEVIPSSYGCQEHRIYIEDEMEFADLTGDFD
ncbi:bifunctional 6-phosphofructo-2-kinase/fructose-2,6-bisphosphate 2-phosphatase [Basidiobolus meristosporus CBS 931.73]|uniref:Bifunctional 6-phosphofructo-2-kinase/fructose-2,6-bisphosphate 2-phosphatase n=1 Tax=Basidiobolus meristosporus CBS 931.73 TaxID=1314790 RepID=A0A1Y1ZCR4_9FUNG|nr:bifunctional 6-phosphofructo-2-kinase/fructose-2,6-bisphosphate 2-phosphatase [Basidiobolus meristosporus CBS 931.73]|eukprot:ORY07605.1 bifunctional 6-phosphofructo-2-kinase/fructose-2,6-bisphosphate 2-phosphatase [Basidiobolus meristosporus CBS 931.73]